MRIISFITPPKNAVYNVLVLCYTVWLWVEWIQECHFLF